MVEHVNRFIEDHPRSQIDSDGPSVLNVGYGLGIVRLQHCQGECGMHGSPQVDRLFQQLDPKPRKHVIIEAHPDVLSHMRDTGVYDWPNVHILEGRWQDHLQGEKLGEVIELADGGFDAVFIDTFAEGYDGTSLADLFPCMRRPKHSCLGPDY